MNLRNDLRGRIFLYSSHKTKLSAKDTKSFHDNIKKKGFRSQSKPLFLHYESKKTFI